jgi:hypothetical protein
MICLRRYCRFVEVDAVQTLPTQNVPSSPRSVTCSGKALSSSTQPGFPQSGDGTGRSRRWNQGIFMPGPIGASNQPTFLLLGFCFVRSASHGQHLPAASRPKLLEPCTLMDKIGQSASVSMPRTGTEAPVGGRLFRSRTAASYWTPSVCRSVGRLFGRLVCRWPLANIHIHVRCKHSSEAKGRRNWVCPTDF